jgi:glycosyltransferase involved in cell wall biosynthesis
MRPSKQTAGVRLLVDGIIFQQQRFGGIRRLHGEVLTRLPSEVDLRVVTEGPIEGELPVGLPRRRIPSMVDLLRPGRLWGPLVPRATAAARRWAYGDGEGDVFWSTYYTRPPEWSGAEVVWVYDMIHERFAEEYGRDRDDELRRRKREAVDHADAVIAISRATADDLQATYGIDLGDRLSVVPLAPVVLGVPSTTAGEPYLLHVGGRAGYKGFLALLRAYATWPGRHDVRLLAAGGPWTEDEEQAIAALGLADRVSVVVEPNDRRLGELYAGAAAFVHPSRAEGFGLIVLEAMAAGVPVVAARLAVTQEVGGDIPFWFELDDDEGLHAALDQALATDGARRDAGRARAAGYNWEVTAAGAVAALRSVAP